MADRVYPSTKPAPPGDVAGGGNGVASAPPLQKVSAPPGAVKPQIYNPNRPPRPQHYGHGHRTRRKFCTCCCCLFWAILLFLILALIAAIAAVAFWVLYRPHYPTFRISNFRLANLNLTTTTDTTHLTSAMNLTLSTSNPNKKFSFFYCDVSLSVLSLSGVLLANTTSPSFSTAAEEVKTLKLHLRSGADLEADDARRLKSDLKKKSLAIRVKAETRVRVKIGKMKTKRVIIVVTCEGIRGRVPSGKMATVASTVDSKCSVDFRFKIWRFTF